MSGEVTEPLSLAQPVRLMRQMSHDMRSPLNVLIATVSMFTEGLYGDLTPEQRRAMDRMRRNGDRIVQILDALMIYVKAEANQYVVSSQPFDMAALLRDTIFKVQPVAEKAGIDINLNVDSSVPQILIGANTAIAEITLAMLWNAVAFMPEGQIVVNAAYRDGQMHLTVKDAGPGIPPEDAPHLFEPFWHNLQPLRATPTSACGLGLAVAAALSRLLNGEIRLQETSETGSTFAVWLPLLASDITVG